jgi:hypothetical protein
MINEIIDKKELKRRLTMSILLSDHAFEWLKKTWLEINKEK